MEVGVLSSSFWVAPLLPSPRPSPLHPARDLTPTGPAGVPGRGELEFLLALGCMSQRLCR